MQYKVPQNIDLEDKIIGPLTLAQFIYLIFGGLIVYITFQFFYHSARGLFFLIALPTSLLALALAFVKVYDRPFGTFLKNAVSFVMSPRERVWHKEGALEGDNVIRAGPAVPRAQQAQEPQKQVSGTQLAKLSEILDTTDRPTSALTAQGTTSSTGGSELRRASLPMEGRAGASTSNQPLHGQSQNKTS